MDISTIIFIVTIAIAFIFLRWLISPIPQTNEFGIPSEPSGGASSTGISSGSTRNTARSRRPVADSMIEVVATIAPSLTREQIIYDLQKTGSVELTINNYMENNGLPFPPRTDTRNETRTNETRTNETTPIESRSGTNSSNRSTNPKEHQIDFKSVNLFEKYHIDINDPKVNSDNDLLAKKQAMIINARYNLQKQLSQQ
jgi:coupling of ubiquitin conjugation to ER degradation protein 1